MTIPDKIEEVNAEYLTRLVAEEKYITVLFFDESKGNHRCINNKLEGY